MATNTAKAGVAIGTAAAIAAAIALIKTQPAHAAPDQIIGLDDATMNLLCAIAQGVSNLEEGQLSKADIQKLADAIQTMTVSGVIGVVPNTESIIAGRVQIAALNTAYGFPDIAVPDGMSVAIKGWPTNAGLIYVGSTAATCTNINQIWPLLPNEIVWFKVKNTKKLHISGNAVGDWAVFTVEQRGRR